MAEQNNNASQYLELTTDVVSAFVSNNSVSASDLANLIAAIHGAFVQLAEPAATQAAEAQKPAVPTKKSVTADYIICLEDGLQFKSLKRHIRTKYNLTPAEYRVKWGLPTDYPMVAPSYAAARSELAKQMGLGQQRKKAVASRTPPKAQGRAKKTAA